MASPRVSILMATWNRGHLIGRGIKSALDQTLTDWEFIIAGDGPPPETEAAIREWAKKDKRVRYVRHEHTGRIAITSNAGLKVARGEYVAVLDDDDWWLDREKLAKQVAFLDAHPNYIVCGGGFVFVDGDGKEIGRELKPETDEKIRRVALAANPVVNSSSIFRREPAGLYDEAMPQFADWDFWLRLGNMGKLYNFQEYFLAYRMWEKGSSFTHQKENVNAAFMIIRRYRNDYPGFYVAFFIAAAYWTYAHFPLFIRKSLNSSLSRFKKRLFAR